MHIPVHQLISFLLENETIPLLNPSFVRICDSYVLNGHTGIRCIITCKGYLSTLSVLVISRSQPLRGMKLSSYTQNFG